MGRKIRVFDVCGYWVNILVDKIVGYRERENGIEIFLTGGHSIEVRMSVGKFEGMVEGA